MTFEDIFEIVMRVSSQRLNNDLDLFYSQIKTTLITNFRSKLYKKSFVSAFSHI